MDRGELTHPLTPICLLAALACMAAPGLARSQRISIEVHPLANSSSLTAQDVSVLDGVVRSDLAQLPNERFEISQPPVSAEPGCSGSCLALAAGARGASHLLIGSIASFGEGFIGTLDLYDASSGQLESSETTDVVSNPTSLVGEIKAAAAHIRKVIDPEPASVPVLASPIQATPQTPAMAGNAGGPTATLRVVTDPPGAKIFIQRVGNTELAGVSPLEKILLPVEYRVIARLPEHKSAVREVRLDPFEVETMTLILKRVYPMSPHKKWGHIMFWPGLVVTGFGFVSMGKAQAEAYDYRISLNDMDRDNARAWTGGMWASFGLGTALMITGTILWAATPSSKEHWEKNHAAGIAPVAGGGAVAAYGRSF